MKVKGIVKSLAAFAAFAVMSGVSAESTAQRDKTGNIVLENEFIRAVVTAQGGKLLVFEDKVRKINHAVSDDTDMAGIGKSRVFDDLTCTEFYTEVWAIKVLRGSGDEALVECSYTAKDRAHAWHGFEMIKRYSLRKGEYRLRMEWIVNSHASTGKMRPFMHNYLRIREQSFAFAQTADGLFCREVRAATARDSTAMVRNVTEPWGAIVSPEAKEGMLCYDASHLTREFLFWLDGTQPTIEPLFEETAFAHNSSWRTQYLFAPLDGLKSCHFATAEYAAGFAEEDGKNVLKFLPLTDMGKTSLKIRGNKALLHEFEFNAKAGKALTFPVPQVDKLLKLKIDTAWTGGNETHDIWASPLPEGQVKGERELRKDEDAGREYARAHVPKGEMFVTPDMVVPLPTFSVKNFLTGKTRNTLRLEIDAPKGIRLFNPIALYGACHDEISSSDVEIDGKPYARYVIAKLSHTTCVNGNIVFASTDWEAGRTGSMYYQLKWDGGEGTRRQIPVTSVHVPQAPFPRLLITNIPGFGMRQAQIDHWPGFYEVMRRVGNNTISATGSMLRNAASGNSKEIEGFFKKALAEGFYTFANFSPFYRNGWSGAAYTEDISKFPAVSLTGETSNWPCPSYRGKAFQDHVETMAAAGRYGATMLELDTECWSGGDYCYCDRCLARFKEFMAERHSGTDYMDPRTFRKSPERHPEHNRIWNDFKAMLGCEMYRPIAELFAKHVREAGKPGPYMFGTYDAIPSDRIYSMFLRNDDLLREGIVNNVQPSPYTRGNALRLSADVREGRKATGNSNVLTWMSAGWVYPDDEYPARDFRYCLLENFINGARGCMILPWYGLDADDYREHAITMQMVVPVEDIIVEGNVMKNLQTSNRDVKICGLQKGSEYLVLLSEYYETGNTPVSFNLEVEEDCTAVDMMTGEVIATLARGGNTIDAVIPHDDRAVLVYIGNREIDFSNRVQYRTELMEPVKRTSADIGIGIAPEGKLTITEDGRRVIVANPFYKITFFSRGGHNEVEFVNDSKKLEFYCAFSLLYETTRLWFPDANKREIKKSADGKTVRLRYAGSFKTESYDIDYRVAYTFYHDRPVFRFEGEVKQNPVVRLGGSWNTWNFSPETAGEMPFYRTGPSPAVRGMLRERAGSGIEAGDWKDKYKYFAITDGSNAFGMITSSRENASIYVHKESGGYLTGSRIRTQEETFSSTHYTYIGPEKDLPVWSAKLYSE